MNQNTPFELIFWGGAMGREIPHPHTPPLGTFSASILAPSALDGA